eukprot:5487188-Amphidinium_carterae.1
MRNNSDYGVQAEHMKVTIAFRMVAELVAERAGQEPHKNSLDKFPATTLSTLHYARPSDRTVTKYCLYPSSTGCGRNNILKHNHSGSGGGSFTRTSTLSLSLLSAAYVASQALC